MILLVKPEAADNGFSLDMALKTEPLELEYIKAMPPSTGAALMKFLMNTPPTRWPSPAISRRKN